MTLLVCFSKISQSLSSLSLLASFCAVRSAIPPAILPDLAALNSFILYNIQKEIFVGWNRHCNPFLALLLLLRFPPIQHLNFQPRFALGPVFRNKVLGRIMFLGDMGESLLTIPLHRALLRQHFSPAHLHKIYIYTHFNFIKSEAPIKSRSLRNKNRLLKFIQPALPLKKAPFGCVALAVYFIKKY